MKNSCIFLFCLWLSHSISEGKMIILTTQQSGEPSLKGDTKLTDEPVTAASTFKMVIAWSALERKVATPETKHLCKDKHVPGTPREITMKEAMFFSSNDFFRWLAKEIGPQALTQDIRKSGFFITTISDEWYGNDESSIIHGGTLKTTARQEHIFMQNVMNGKLSTSAKIQEQLLKTLSWPSNDSEIALYGKTGSYDGVFWFNGFGVQQNKSKAVTVLCTGKDASRDQAIETFYHQWNLGRPKL